MIALTTRPVAEPRPLLLTARQAAEAMGISERTMWEITKGGQIPCLRIPGRGKARSIRYAVPDLEAWIERTKAAQTATDSAAPTE